MIKRLLANKLKLNPNKTKSINFNFSSKIYHEKTEALHPSQYC